ncbi:MAG: acetyl-CoA carboxylase carboxyltransferase subunit alpha [Clostridiales bacterium]|jgi:acetyl-CoA carboxylase carboxyl transferase subunit beta|nr:acetyl-CoA carboxylase carboxyltransferase subunit alpha [Clostridiales bacterium]
MNIFNRKKYVTIPQGVSNTEPGVPDGMWAKCAKCQKTAYSKQLGAHKICPGCGAHFRIGAREMLAIIADEGSFKERDADMIPNNPIDYPGYGAKITGLGAALDVKEAVISGRCAIGGVAVMLCIMDSRFIMGSMGSVVGEKITRAFEEAAANRLPIVVFTASGGARMQEGIISLMQMAKVSAAAKRHCDAGLLYISVLTDPTTGGVTASYAMQADIILAEPGATVGFAGRRVIEQTMKQTLPEDFQSAEFVLEHGFIDKIVRRDQMREILSDTLKSHAAGCAKFDESRKINIYSGSARIEPSEAVEISRKISRPTSKDIIEAILTDFIEFHGDRNFRDDTAVVGGVGYLGATPITVVATQKGRNLEENVANNFGQPHPEGYRKALRLMKQAEKFGRPVLSLVNTSGAYCATGAEERGQGQAIAQNLYNMSGLQVPIISVIVGEGGSGGALALAVADRVFMFEYSMYSILSPEGFASILWKDAKRAKEAAAVMKLRPVDLMELNIIEGIIPEVPGGFDNDIPFSLDYLKHLLVHEFSVLQRMPTEEMLDRRYDRFRKFGAY